MELITLIRFMEKKQVNQLLAAMELSLYLDMPNSC